MTYWHFSTRTTVHVTVDDGLRQVVEEGVGYLREEATRQERLELERRAQDDAARRRQEEARGGLNTSAGPKGKVRGLHSETWRG